MTGFSEAKNRNFLYWKWYSMKIEKLIIKNFRCFGPEPVTVDFENEVTALVGGNGSGKTALLLALSRLFGVTPSQRSVKQRDFHIDPLIGKVESGATLFIECILGFPELDSEDENDTDPVPEFFNHMSASGPGEPLKVRIRLQAVWIDDGTLEGTIEEDIRWINTLENNFDWESCPKVSPIERATIQLVYLPAARNTTDCVTSLLKGRLWKAAKWSSKLLRSVQRSTALIQKRFEQEEPTRLIIERLTSRWQQLYKGDTDTTPVLRTLETQLDDLMSQVNLVFHPDESGQDHRFNELSDGQRSLFHIALTAALLELERDVDRFASIRESPFDQQKLRHTHLTILAIEEPENSLSPFFLSRIMNQAREIGRLSSAQVILSSHSASILSRIEPEEVRYFRHDSKSRRTSVCRLSLPEDEIEARQYVRLAVRAYPELYFARFVILGEGDSERVVLPRLAEAMNVPLDPSFIPIVPLASRYVNHFWRLLNDLQIPYATLLDLDLGRVHGGTNIIRKIVEVLNEIGNDLSQNPYVISGDVNLNQLNNLDDTMLMDGSENNIWLKMLRHEGIFFSYPLDLDFAMLAAFPNGYQRPHIGGRGPKNGPEDIIRKKEITLKTGGNPNIYEKHWDSTFIWYPYLFLNRSKPESHFIALSRIKDESLITDAPVELKELISHIKQIFYNEEGNM